MNKYTNQLFMDKLVVRAIKHEIDRLSGLVDYLDAGNPENDRWSKGLSTKSKNEIKAYKEMLNPS